MMTTNETAKYKFYSTDAMFDFLPTVVYAASREEAAQAVLDECGVGFFIGRELTWDDQPIYPTEIGILALTDELVEDALDAWDDEDWWGY